MIPNWELVYTQGGSKVHLAFYEDQEMGVCKLVETPVRDMSFGKPRYEYALKYGRKLFLTEDELIDEWERQHKGGISMRIEDHCPKCGSALSPTPPPPRAIGGKS